AMMQPMGVEQLAAMVAMRDSPQAAEMPSSFPVIDRVRVGTKRNMHFRIYVSPDSFKAASLSDCSFPPDAVYSLNNLPGDLQKKFNDSLKQMRDAYRQAGVDGGPDKGAPPR
ncbi:MAG TPA: hypothetical protein VKT78_07690, partial [Fimbriimonadaceae bacterium]|nr:hypothetical protein [Fimbriimonadaceae bacterium]